MKKIKYLILGIFTFIISTNIVFAAGTASLSTNVSTIENGSKVKATLSLRGVAAWNVTIHSSGSTSGCTEKFVGDSGTAQNVNKTFTVTCPATSTGIINFSVSGDITSANGENVKISGSKSVKVVTPRQKSSNNKLKSLSITGFEITPAFNVDTKEYQLLVPSTTEKITINAAKEDRYASIEGTGEKEVHEGANFFEVIVTSETGVSNIYTITVTVEDLNPIEVTIGKEKFTVVKEARNLVKPDLFDETTIKINDIDVPAFVNEVSKYILVGLKDSNSQIELYIYKGDKYIKYKEFNSGKVSVIFLEDIKKPKYFEKTSLTLDDEKIVAYKHNDLVLVYATNIATGKTNYYSYDDEEKTLQIFDINDYSNLVSKTENSKIIIVILSILLIISIIISTLLYFDIKKTSKIKIKEGYKKNKPSKK
ncbi:MAG: cadherin-like beta sandwich domain-containing protein [Bacilli bacterium]|nr:cadherin-like beta sandwich domain-containing protein [Bacilli bacterium]MDD4408184.1 cadherin-like beta sandwich domain-containing protein [Bacilli bacterium]